MAKRPLNLFSFILFALLGFSAAIPAAHADDLSAIIDSLAVGGFNEREAAINTIGASGDPRVVPTLNALESGKLFSQKLGGKVVIVEPSDGTDKIIDPLSLKPLGDAEMGALEKIKVNNRLRRAVNDALATLQLRSPNPVDRLSSAQNAFKSQDPDGIKLLDGAIAHETVPSVKAAMLQARAAAVLASDMEAPAKIEAIGILKERADRDVRSMLMAFSAKSEGELKAAADRAVVAIDSSLALWGTAQNVWYGLSLGSVLLLAAIGLAITFGVMGVINMAHGEMVMLGAYTTFVVQDVIRNSYPGLFEFSLLISIPLAFLVAGAVGVAIERGIIRFLYGRPLETLLATWGISLALQQAVRSIFGPTNQEVGNPDFMSGAFAFGQMTITYNRLYILIFAMFVLFALMLVMKKTPYGLQMRAVTQNRRMAGAMGIRTDWVDALTFGLGSGIAGIAGVALSQIDNVSPNLGQSYIIDSFMVVVFGGVGNLWGTLVGAMTLGIANKFLEPYAGAVLGKIVVLVFIILFIQKKPRGMFAQKGRAVEA